MNGKCVDLCTSTTCSGETPDCEAKDHDYTCKCTERSCETGKQCLDGKCESCAVGTKCNCDGEKVIDASGKCVCPADKSCAAGQYLNNDCSCKNCLENDTGGNKCGCPGNTVPNGEGGCYCKTPLSCDAGYSFDASYSCECVPCTDNASCDNPCPEGSFPNGSGCGTYACMDDSNCGEANRCENGGTESAECVPCGKNEQCNCPDGQLSDGSGNCVSVTCKTGSTCDGSTTEQCCDAGMQCVNPDTVESYCAACEVDTQCTCPDGYLVNKEGKCVKPACTKNSDCPNGNKCDNAGKSNATCTPCAKGETCTCTGGMVSDGNGGCEFGCEFSSASACKSGTDNCSNCSMSGGCYVCSSCGTGYELSGSTCSPKSCPSGTSTYPSCPAGQKAASTSSYSGPYACKQCVDCASGATDCGCPSGKIANGNGGCKSADPCADVTCDGGKICSAGSCVCPSDKPYSSGGQCRECTTDSHCGATQECSNYQCVDLNCGTCETLSNHSCKTIADCCVSDASCKANEKCIDNKCEEQCGCESFEYCKGGKCYLQAGRCYDDSNCINSDKCVSHSCVNACSPDPCSGQQPRCLASSHKAVCMCTSSSCPTGYWCNGRSPYDCKPNGCTSDSDCPNEKKCSNGECVDPCSPNPCSGQQPRCLASSHKTVCMCTSSSCPTGYSCNNMSPYDCKIATTEKCTMNDDCSAEKTCSNGYCIFKD